MDAAPSVETTAIDGDAGGANALPTPGGDQHARVSGSIPGVSVEVTSTYAYRDWMPRMGGPRGEDGGSPLHIAIGLVIENGSERTVTLDRSARLGATGTPLEPVRLDDLASETAWPLELQPGAQRRLQIGTRDGPYFPLGEALDLEIDLSDAAGASVRIAIDDLPIGRTD